MAEKGLDPRLSLEGEPGGFAEGVGVARGERGLGLFSRPPWRWGSGPLPVAFGKIVVMGKKAHGKHRYSSPPLPGAGSR